MSVHRATIFFLIFAIPTALFAQSNDELFEKVFKRKPLRTKSPYTVTLIVDNQDQGILTIKATPFSKNISFPKATLLSKFKSSIIPKELKKLKSKFKNETVINSSDLSELGFLIVYSPKRQLVSINTPVSYRNEIRVNIMRSSFSRNNNQIGPDPFSGFLNVRSIHTKQYYTSSNTDNTWVSLEGNVYANGILLQSEGDYISDETDPWSVSGARAIIDNKEWRLRLTGGSITPPILGSQNAPDLFGIGASKQWQYHPLAPIHPQFEQKITITKKSNVSIFINNNLVYQGQFSEGKYIFQNLPLVYGLNRIKIDIENKTDKKRSIQTNFYEEQQLLAPGEQEFTYNFGYPYTTFSEIQNLTSIQPHSQFFHRFGLTNTITLGPYAQYNQSSHLIGSNIQTAFPLGLLSLDLAKSNDINNQTGLSKSLNLYGYRMPILDTTVRFNLRIQDLDYYFSNTGESTNNDTQTIISPGIDISLNPTTKLQYSTHSRRIEPSQTPSHTPRHCLKVLGIGTHISLGSGETAPLETTNPPLNLDLHILILVAIAEWSPLTKHSQKTPTLIGLIIPETIEIFICN